MTVKNINTTPEIVTDPAAAKIGDLIIRSDGVYTKTAAGERYLAPTLSGSDTQASAAALKEAIAAEPTPASIAAGIGNDFKKGGLLGAAAAVLVAILILK